MFHETPQISICKQRNLLFLRHGPIDLFLGVDTEDEAARKKAFRVAAASFEPILPGLCGELGLLRRPVTTRNMMTDNPVAARMIDTVSKFSGDRFVTPMIAVAGSVADHLTQCTSRKIPARRIFVNNGGDISVRLTGEETFTVGICTDIVSGEIITHATLHAEDGIGGIATSGWAGRSHSLGIADAVTVFASDAATADTAATLIANAVDLPSSAKIERMPANQLDPDSDLGDRPVTTNVMPLDEFEKQDALQAGGELARTLQQSGILCSAYLSLQGAHLAIEAGASLRIAARSTLSRQNNSQTPELAHA